MEFIMHHTVQKPSLLVTAILTTLLATFSPLTFAAVGTLDLTSSGIGFFCLILFVIAYLLVMGEELLHLRKSKPVLVAAGIIWMLLGWIYTQEGMPHEA